MSATMLQMTTEDDIKRADKYAEPMVLDCTVDEYLDYVRNCPELAHVLHMHFGQARGWWEKWNERGPIKVVRLEISEFNEKSKMAHVLSHDKVRVFKSASEAIKADHKGPVKIGTFLFNKGMLEVIIE